MTALAEPSSPVQQFDFLLALFAPLVSTEEAAFLLDGCSHDHVHHLIDDGTLRAIDIKSPGATNRTLRIYRYSIEHLLIRPRSKCERVPAETILQHTRPTWLIREVAALLRCTEAHVRNLALAGPNIASANATRHLPRIYRTAILEFLTTREIDA